LNDLVVSVEDVAVGVSCVEFNDRRLRRAWIDGAALWEWVSELVLASEQFRSGNIPGSAAELFGAGNQLDDGSVRVQQTMKEGRQVCQVRTGRAEEDVERVVVYRAEEALETKGLLLDQ
jgi:hypothetical protein